MGKGENPPTFKLPLTRQNPRSSSYGPNKMSKRPPAISLSALADRCASLRQLSQVHAQMILTGRIPGDAYAASRLLSSYALTHNHLPLALSLFSQTPSPNSFVFNTLIRALSLSSSPHLSFIIYSHMQCSAVPPGKHTFPFLLKASANLRSLPYLTQQVHTHVFKHGLELDVYVTNALMHSYGCCGLVAHARKVFDETPDRNSMIWTTMVSGYAQNSLPDEAVTLFEGMVQSGVEPCGATLASVLSACARSGGLETGRRVHGLVREKGIGIGVILGTALVDMYVKNGAILEAREVFVGMPDRNTATWNAMICGSAHHGHCDGAIQLFQEMEREVRPNDITFTGVLTACCHARWVELGRQIFRSMEKKYGVEPKVEHYGCMVDLLGRSGRLEEAEELVRGMKWEADVVVWGALLTACRNYGNIEIAERVVEEMLKLDPENHGVYVVLSNMCAEAGRWEDVERLRSVMRDVGLKKIPGWSSVVGHGC